MPSSQAISQYASMGSTVVVVLVVEDEDMSEVSKTSVVAKSSMRSSPFPKIGNRDWRRPTSKPSVFNVHPDWTLELRYSILDSLPTTCGESSMGF